MIPYGRQSISEKDINAVVDVLKSSHLTQGPKVPAFEQAIANYCDAKYSVATNSATSALHIACLSLGVGEDDIVWTSPISFVASANCALYCGATVDFVDIDINSGNICVDALEQKLKKAHENGKLPKVVIPVHLGGQSCDMKAINLLANTYGFKVIEDASHAIGAKYRGKIVGCCYYSDITIFSFHPVKIITSGEGGIALTNDNSIAQKMRQLRSHGVTADESNMTEPSHGPWYYQQLALGFNYRMTELQAALALSQLDRLTTFISKRNTIAQTYTRAFSQTKITPLTLSPHCYSAFHLYIILLPNTGSDSQKKVIHKKAVTDLRAANIFAHVHYIPIHMQPYFKQLGFNLGDFPNAESYYSRAISLPLFPDLTSKEQSYVIDSVLSLL